MMRNNVNHVESNTPLAGPYGNAFWQVQAHESTPSEQRYASEKENFGVLSRSFPKPTPQTHPTVVSMSEFQDNIMLPFEDSQKSKEKLNLQNQNVEDFHYSSQVDQHDDRLQNLVESSLRFSEASNRHTLSRARSTDHQTPKRKILQRIGIHSPTHKRVAAAPFDLEGPLNLDCVPSKAAKVLGTRLISLERQSKPQFTPNSMPTRASCPPTSPTCSSPSRNHQLQNDKSAINQEGNIMLAKSPRKLPGGIQDPRLRTLNERLSSFSHSITGSQGLRYYENELPPTPPSKPRPNKSGGEEESLLKSPRKVVNPASTLNAPPENDSSMPSTILVEGYRDGLTINDRGSDVRSWHGDIQRINNAESPITAVHNRTPNRNLLPPSMQVSNVQQCNGISPSIYSGGPWSPLSPETRAMFYPPPLVVPQSAANGNLQVSDDKNSREFSYSSASASIPLYYDDAQHQSSIPPVENSKGPAASQIDSNDINDAPKSNSGPVYNLTNSVDSHLVVLNQNMSSLIDTLEKSHNETNDRVAGLEVNVNVIKATLSRIQSTMLNLEMMILVAVNPAAPAAHATWPGMSSNSRDTAPQIPQAAQGGWHSKPSNMAPVAAAQVNSKTQAYFDQLGQGLHSLASVNGRPDLGIHPAYRGDPSA